MRFIGRRVGLTSPGRHGTRPVSCGQRMFCPKEQPGNAGGVATVAGTPSPSSLLSMRMGTLAVRTRPGCIWPAPQVAWPAPQCNRPRPAHQNTCLALPCPAAVAPAEAVLLWGKRQRSSGPHAVRGHLQGDPPPCPPWRRPACLLEDAQSSRQGGFSSNLYKPMIAFKPLQLLRQGAREGLGGDHHMAPLSC